MDNEALLDAELAAHIKAQNCSVYYKGTSVRAATESGMRSAACADEWMRLREEVLRRGLTALTP